MNGNVKSLYLQIYQNRVCNTNRKNHNGPPPIWPRLFEHKKEHTQEDWLNKLEGGGAERIFSGRKQNKCQNIVFVASETFLLRQLAFVVKFLYSGRNG